jgi:hypothetical protein
MAIERLDLAPPTAKHEEAKAPLPRVLPPEAFQQLDRAFREALALCIKDCPLSRYEISSRISELQDHTLTKDRLDKFTSESSTDYRMQAVTLAAFCVVTGCRLPLEVLAEAIGCVLVGPEEAKQLELARLFQRKAELEKQIEEKGGT